MRALDIRLVWFGLALLSGASTVKAADDLDFGDVTETDNLLKWVL